MQSEGEPMDRLEQAMANIAQAVRTGNLISMAELAAQTESALAALGPDVDAARLTALRNLAQRNAVGLEAAGRGIRAARRRLKEIAAMQAGGKTYDNAGNTQKIGGPDGALKARY